MTVHESVCVLNHDIQDPALPLPVFLDDLTRRILEEGHETTRGEAARLAAIDKRDAMLLFHYAKRLRERFRGDTVSLCSIVNAKSGACPEDCSFCAQSAHFQTAAPVYGLMKPGEVLQTARLAERDGAESFGVVISGRGIKNDKELQALGEIVKTLKREVNLDIHASVGICTREQLQYLRECGVTMINHNLETSERFYPSICTTHTFQDRVETIRTARACGLNLCVGGIFGMGETWDDRIDMAFTLRELDVDTVPLNFLHRIQGTPLETREPLAPLTILSIIALFRFILPRKEIKICGGRESNLRDLQSLIFLAGADSMMIGNYLTTAGREPELDWKMMDDLELTWTRRGQGCNTAVKSE
ncbi:MAG TPA: biotin synthase BioB [bacterium]|nr:biotin synthase BioB [bacterium]HOL92932.1 biotin synthase BioB [bacterium]HPP00252.1 biotin synthase BioB [bacterium]HXK95211.1 biotin synthase BioB [bacterium]